MALVFVGLFAVLALPAGAVNAALGIRPARAPRAASPQLFFRDVELLASPFALAQVFPASAFPSGHVTCGRSVTLLLDDFCSVVGSITSIGAEAGVVLQYSPLPAIGKVKIIARGSQQALKLFVRIAQRRQIEDSMAMRITWAER